MNNNKDNKILHDLMFSNECAGDYVTGTNRKAKKVVELFYACEECGQPITCDGDILSDLQVSRIGWEENDDTRYMPGNCCRLTK